MNAMFNNVFNGVTVLITGHTGFKGSWLCIWLEKLGAKVVGYSIDIPTTPSNFDLSNLNKHVIDIRGDTRDLPKLQSVIEEHKPKIIFHLAAQAIVLKAYDSPKETFDTNAGGTVNVLEAVRKTNCVEIVVSITSDKVYHNNEWNWGYRETDLLGDKDPYAASKAMAELAIESYRRSYFAEGSLGSKRVALSSTRAGNVIGGGDFADYRLVPDSMKALILGEPIKIRNPANVRPWQLVLEPLSGYLWLAAKMLGNPNGEYNKAWNFGPLNTKGVTAGEVTDTLVELWGEGSWVNTGTNQAEKEAGLLMLDWSLANRELGWRPVYTDRETLSEVVSWHKEYARQNTSSSSTLDMFETCSKQIDKYSERAKELKIPWAFTDTNKAM
ncbi:CDP-glucose 4,6-dehydratase [Patescibacteria group bacterium]|nr:CDP-glucose 4,6-dehydratase [Patescibacteria group bacterium]MBU1953013.1 CDP-glucose 4,6-dehydratase [Patescibacteria group bacterium]